MKIKLHVCTHTIFDFNPMKMYTLQSDIIKKTAGILQVFTVRYEKTHASCMFEVESSANSISLGSTSTHSSSSSSSSSSSTGDGALRGSRSSNNSSLKTHLQYQKLNLENYRKKHNSSFNIAPKIATGTAYQIHIHYHWFRHIFFFGNLCLLFTGQFRMQVH